MGALFSRWTKKPSTLEVLEKLEKDIDTIEKQRRSQLERERRIVGSLLLYSILLYVAVTCIFYLYYLPDAWQERMKSSIPLISFPILIWILKRFLQWYFVKRITKNEIKLEDLRMKKKSILDDVMETHTYKKAKEILERFDKGGDKTFGLPEETTPIRQKAPDGQELRHRGNGTNATSKTDPKSPSPTSENQHMPNTLGTSGPSASPTANAAAGRLGVGVGHQGPLQEPSGGDTQKPSRTYRRTCNSFGSPMRPPGPPMARPMLPRERSASERILEYLIGDGPKNRYALICRECHSHNGMAYKEEFDYLNFRCCYCYTFNKARRQRPCAPALGTPPHARRSLIATQEPNESGSDRETENSTDVNAASTTKKQK